MCFSLNIFRLCLREGGCFLANCKTNLHYRRKKKTYSCGSCAGWAPWLFLPQNHTRFMSNSCTDRYLVNGCPPARVALYMGGDRPTRCHLWFSNQPSWITTLLTSRLTKSDVYLFSCACYIRNCLLLGVRMIFWKEKKPVTKNHWKMWILQNSLIFYEKYMTFRKIIYLWKYIFNDYSYIFYTEEIGR